MEISQERIYQAAKQNLETDQRILKEDRARGIRMDRDDRALLRLKEPDELYLEEAKYVLETYGENYSPEFPDQVLITAQ